MISERGAHKKRAVTQVKMADIRPAQDVANQNLRDEGICRLRTTRVLPVNREMNESAIHRDCDVLTTVEERLTKN